MTSESLMPDGRRFGGLFIMPGSKGLNPHELAHKWMKDLGTRPKYEHKSGMAIPRYANIGADCGSAKHKTIRRHY